MSTEDLVEELMQKAYKMYKRESRGCRESSRLNLKLPVVISGVEFHCWREYVSYKVCEYIKNYHPDIQVDLYLDGNNSTIALSMSDEDQKVLNQKLYTLLKEIE